MLAIADADADADDVVTQNRVPINGSMPGDMPVSRDEGLHGCDGGDGGHRGLGEELGSELRGAI
jgi:hypothetical protein